MAPEVRERRQHDHEQSFSAPTPYNTYLSPSAHDPSENDHGMSTSSSSAYEAYPQVEGNGPSGGRVSFGASISIPSHTYSGGTTANSHQGLISPNYTFDPTVSVIPTSDLPIPGPPSRLSSADTKSSLIPGGLGEVSSNSSGSGSSSLGGPARWTWRGRRKKAKEEMTQDDRDEARLQQLGYDAVLGREYNFWSSLAITTLNIGALQVSLLPSFLPEFAVVLQS